MAHQVLNYFDVQLYASDVLLFTAPQWLNDNAINFYFQYLFQTVCRADTNVLLMDPALVSCMLLQCEDDDEYGHLGHGMEVQTKQLCLIPVNDNEQFGGSSSHWSLLVFDARTRCFSHYDSSSGHNTTPAVRVASTFLHLLQCSGVDNVPSRARVEHVADAPQQRNGYDCGMYVLMIAEFLCRQACGEETKEGNASLNLHAFVTAASVARKRQEIQAIIADLIEATDNE